MFPAEGVSEYAPRPSVLSSIVETRRPFMEYTSIRTAAGSATVNRTSPPATKAATGAGCPGRGAATVLCKSENAPPVPLVVETPAVARLTVAPATPLPSASTTVPVMAMFCAPAWRANAATNAHRRFLFPIIRASLLLKSSID